MPYVELCLIWLYDVALLPYMRVSEVLIFTTPSSCMVATRQCHVRVLLEMKWCLFVILILLFLIITDPYEYHMDLCNELCLAGWLTSPPSCMAETFIIGHYMHTVWPDLFMPAILIGTIILYFNFQWSWPCLQAPKSAQSKTYCLDILPLFSTDGAKMWYGDEAVQV